MPNKPPHFRPGGKTARDLKKERDREHDRRRNREQESRRWYGTPRWRLLRAFVLRRSPACALCLPRVVPATVADHIKAHKGDPELFWDEENLQGLCASCHNSTKQSEEKTTK